MLLQGGETNDDILEALTSELVGQLVAPPDGKCSSWTALVSQNVVAILDDRVDVTAASREVFCVGQASLRAFLQATVTGPPLTWSPEDILLPQRTLDYLSINKVHLKQQLQTSLVVDGEAVYRLLPFVEVFAFARCLLNHPKLEPSGSLLRWRLRVNTWHQRLLSDISSTLQSRIYDDLHLLEGSADADLLVERASIHLLHGFDGKARNDLRTAAEDRGFQYVLTGRLGKRTKYQEKDLSQLVVLAKSSIPGDITDTQATNQKAPEALQLNDDTVLESIAFSKAHGSIADGLSDNDLPDSLAQLDPAKQPILEPIDSIILLATASSITNTSPQDGLTREETIPYVERVISGGSSNWQIYTQALLVRSRIEGHKSRTAERGVLQLQALVDQIIADISTSGNGHITNGLETPDTSTSTFLPRPKAADSAPAADRLRFLHHLGSPPRWKLEAELADRWVSLGGLRTALEIYERLELWAEAALCWAATGREDKARMIIRRELYDRPPAPIPVTEDEDLDAMNNSREKSMLPDDAPRLFCILGDLEQSASAYERAWDVSNHRYARAQRSLGKLYLTRGEKELADQAYSQSLRVNPQNHAAWFALGCIRLQLEEWRAAIDAFSRAAQVEDSDAETWSNLAVAMLKMSDSPDVTKASSDGATLVKESFTALKRAAALKRDSFKIWQNLLSVAIKLEPPPYAEIVIAQTRLIELLSAIEGEKCIDVPIMEALLADTIRISRGATTAGSERKEASQGKGLEKMVVDLIQKRITPLITTSRRLWLLSAKLAIHLGHPQAALTAYEKAWRSQFNQPGWDSALAPQSKVQWQDVVESTIDLIDAYESFGEREREGGLGKGEKVAKDWKFKARSAARTVLSRARSTWEDEEAYGRLLDRLQELKHT